mmetsp:Transcript_35285/g.103405  ORF Transcript_35285/g.103405 Transcript_35285/m.103405 type:complete len:251 (-) Transcript_35285:39-791(-)
MKRSPSCTPSCCSTTLKSEREISDASDHVWKSSEKSSSPPFSASIIAFWAFEYTEAAERRRETNGNRLERSREPPKPERPTVLARPMSASSCTSNVGLVRSACVMNSPCGHLDGTLRRRPPLWRIRLSSISEMTPSSSSSHDSKSVFASSASTLRTCSCRSSRRNCRVVSTFDPVVSSRCAMFITSPALAVRARRSCGTAGRLMSIGLTWYACCVVRAATRPVDDLLGWKWSVTRLRSSSEPSSGSGSAI